MPIEVGIWKLGAKPERLGFSAMDQESRLETLLAEDLSIVDPGWMLIGRQVHTDHGTIIDLLAVDESGRLVVLELKRNQTPREVVAQLLDYGSWVRDLDRERIESIYEKFTEKRGIVGSEALSFDEAYCATFGVEQVPDTLNDEHRLVLVAASLDPSSERIITYLSETHGVGINAVFFRVFRDGGNEYLSRAWLTDPQKVEEKAQSRRERGKWNGEFYVSFGGGNTNRDWEEARRYGFISAGGGAWYSRTLKMLSPGSRVWVNIPRTGYVGVGVVRESVVPIDDFQVDAGDGARVPITSLPIKAARNATLAEKPDIAEHFVAVDWIKTVPVEQAVKERGLFGIQHTVARPRDMKWVKTIEMLKQQFGIDS